MSIFEQLANNKGTVSSALGKQLAQAVLEDNQADILQECLGLVTYAAGDIESKHIRSGAAKAVEIVAEQRPELVAPHLEQLLPALSLPEPQTRWMILRVMGFCASLNKAIAEKALPFAQAYLARKEGLVLASSADLYLGDLGSLSSEDAETVFPLLERSIENLVPNEQDWILEAFIKIYPLLSQPSQKKAERFALRWQYSARTPTRKRAERLLKNT